MAVNRAHIVDQNFIDSITSLIGVTLPSKPVVSSLSDAELVELMDSMFASRHLDIHARELKAQGECLYTIFYRQCDI